MLVVGLTGGIASGKSTVSAIMAQAGAHVVDADLLAREAVRPGCPAYDEIRDVFGKRILQPDGGIDRSALADLVFGDEQLRRRLEAIVHPRVQQSMEEAVGRIGRQFPQAVIIKDIPLLLETGMTQGLAEIIVVYVPERIQLVRLMARDGSTMAQARARIASQMPMEEKKELATILIDNSHSLEKTRLHTLTIYSQLTRRAATASGLAG